MEVLTGFQTFQSHSKNSIKPFRFLQSLFGQVKKKNTLAENVCIMLEVGELIWNITLVAFSSNMVVMRQNLQEAECRCMSSCHRLIINLLIPLPVPSLILPQPWLTRNYCRSMIILVSTNSPLCWPCHLVWNWKSKYLKIHFQKCLKVDPKMH